MTYATTTCTFGNPLYAHKMGNDPVTFEYPDEHDENFQFATSTCVTVTDTGEATTTGQSFTGGFSYGEVVIGFFMLLLMLGHFFSGVVNKTIGQKAKTVFKQKI